MIVILKFCTASFRRSDAMEVERFMEFIKVTNENIDKEHICCAISNNNDIQVSSKKEWLKEQYREELVFLVSWKSKFQFQ